MPVLQHSKLFQDQSKWYSVSLAEVRTTDMVKIDSYKGLPRVETGNGTIFGLMFRDWKPIAAFLVFLEIISNLELSIYVSLINSFQSKLPIKVDSVYRASATHTMSFSAIVLLLNNASFSLLSFFIFCLTANSHSLHFCLNMKSASTYKYHQKVSSLHHNLNYCEKGVAQIWSLFSLCYVKIVQ